MILAVVFTAATRCGAAASRNVPDASAAVAAALNSLTVHVPDSPACDGSSATGANAFTNTYILDGPRGRAYSISGQDSAYVSGETVNGDRSIVVNYFQDAPGIGFQGLPCYTDHVDTNNACNLIANKFDGFLMTINGQDRFDLVYQTDRIWNQGLYGFVFGVSVTTNWDEAGNVEFSAPSLALTEPGDNPSVVYAWVSNPLAFPSSNIVWQIDGSTTNETLGCTIVNVTNGIATIASSNISGTITLRAYSSDFPSCWIEGDLKVGGCASCQNNPPTCTQCSDGSVKITMSAGNTLFGQSAGQFQIYQQYPSTALSTPAVLQYYTGSLTTNDVTVVRSGGVVQQVIAPQISANVVSNSPYQFQVVYYTNGTLTGTPYSTWTIQNPDGSASSNRLTVTESMGGSTVAEYDYAWNSTSHGWSLTSENGGKVETKYNTTNGVLRTETHLIYDGSTNLVSQQTNIYQTFAWGERLIQQTFGGGTNALTTTWSFYTNSSDIANYSQIYQLITPGNHWERYYYQSFGIMSRKVTQYLDAPVPANTTQENTNRVTSYGFYKDTDGFFTQAVTNFLNSQQISWNTHHYYKDEIIDTEIQTPDPSYPSSYWLQTTTWATLTAPFIGQPAAILRPDGTMSIYSYALSADGKFTTNTVSTGQPDSGQAQIVDGTTTVTVINQAGTQISQQTFDVASSLLTSSATTLAFDTEGRPTLVQYLDGTTEATVYGCCGIDFFTDREGVTTSYNYDPFTKQVTDTTVLGITTHNDYDAAGRLVKTTRIGTDSSHIIQNLSTYDTAGRLTSSTPGDNGSGLNQTTSYSEYFDASNHLIDVTTNPDGGTRIETHYQDGALISVTGTSVFPVQYSYGMSTTSLKYGEFTKEIKTAQTNEWTATYQDALGRNFLTVYSAASGSPSSQSIFNILGQLIEQIDPDGVATLYQYNGKGEVAYTATDMNGNNSVDFATDRLSGTINDVTTDHGVTVSRSRSFVWNVNGSTASNLVSLAETSADGLQSWNVVFDNGIGITNSSLTSYDPTHGYRIVTSTAPDGSSTIATYQFGRLISTTSKDGSGGQIGQMTYGYDAHGRQNTSTDVRNGTTTSYYNNADQVVAVLSPSPDGVQSGQSTTNSFDGVSRLVRTTLPDNTSITNVYYTNGLLQKTFGSRTYPVAYTYDYAGRMATMTTWTNFATSGGAAVTTWKYDGFRGFLTNKLYADANGPAYSYTAAGRLASRTWERTFSLKHGSANLQSFYAYNPAGELSSVTYTDASPSLSYVYDRLGRQTVITNGTNVCTLAYDDVGNLLSESYSGGPLNGLSVTNGYDTLLRRTALALASQSATFTQYGYDPASRLQSVVNGAHSATYSYVANSPLVGQITFKSNSVVRMTTTKTYDNLNRLTQISSVGAGSPITFNYSYNTANQRSSVTNADNSYWVYQYDNLGQVTNGLKHWADGTPVSGQQFTYNFDDIGNRKSTASGGDSSGANLRSATYTNNALNQITGRTVPGFMTVIGSASSNATVTVNLQRANRYGNYFSDELAVTNTSAAIWQPFTNVAVLNNGTNADIITTNQGNGLVIKTPEIFVYDADGNLTSDGRFTYAWDDENRLTNITSQSGIPNAAKIKLDMVYDYMGRRIQKIVSTNNGTSYVASYTNKFVYDEWNLIAELAPNNALIRSYAWGSDLSGSIQGEGGVGGLLAMSYYGTSITNCFAAFDGNGNVAGLVNGADGNIVAQYEYGPFSEPLRANGSMAKVNPIRFSTKFQDESDLLYYGYRYCNLSTGRWQSRDPAEEQGGANIFGFVLNNPLQYRDLLGLDVFLYFWNTSQGNSGSGHVGIGAGTQANQTFYEANPVNGNNSAMITPYKHEGSEEIIIKQSEDFVAFGDRPSLILQIKACSEDDAKVLSALQSWFEAHKDWSLHGRTDCADAVIVGLNAIGIKPEKESLFSTPQGLSRSLEDKYKYSITAQFGDWDEYNKSHATTGVIKQSGGAILYKGEQKVIEKLNLIIKKGKSDDKH